MLTERETQTLLAALLRNSGGLYILPADIRDSIGRKLGMVPATAPPAVPARLAPPTLNPAEASAELGEDDDRTAIERALGMRFATPEERAWAEAEATARAEAEAAEAEAAKAKADAQAARAPNSPSSRRAVLLAALGMTGASEYELEANRPAIEAALGGANTPDAQIVFRTREPDVGEDQGDVELEGDAGEDTDAFTRELAELGETVS